MSKQPSTPSCSFAEQMHFMACQAKMLDEEGNDVSAKVMRDAIKVLVAERQRAQDASATLREILACDDACAAINYKGAPAGTSRRRSRAVTAARKIVRTAS